MDQIDNYKIVEKIGEGGMGEVYKGVDVMLEREVAIKLLRPELSSREDIVNRFRSEAVALGRLNHSNIAVVYNFGKLPAGQFYMALEFVHGDTLDAVIKRSGSLPWQKAVKYALGILEGLDHAHGFNIVHRDIKPANIVVTNHDTVKILDFGIARILETARLTRVGHLVGTLEYVSPEQIQGKDTDAKSDIYSVGVVLYEMLTGHIPFEKETEYDLIKSQIEEKPKAPHTLCGNIPPKLEKLVLKALEKNPDKRFASAREFCDALIAVSNECADSMRAAPARLPSNKLWGFCREYPGPVFLLALLAFGLIYFLWMQLGAADFAKSPDIATVSASQPPAALAPLAGNDGANAENPDQDPNKKPDTGERLPPPPIVPIQPVAESPLDGARLPAPAKIGAVSAAEDNKARVKPPTPAKPKKERRIADDDPGIGWAADNFFN